MEWYRKCGPLYCEDNKPDEDIINQYLEMGIKEVDLENTKSYELVNAIEKTQPNTRQQSPNAITTPATNENEANTKIAEKSCPSPKKQKMDFRN